MTYYKENLSYLGIIILILVIIFLEYMKEKCTRRIREESKNSLFPHSTVVQL